MASIITTRYAVIAKSGKTLKNANTREDARSWKRDSGKMGLRIYDRHRREVIS